ncbi:MAG TPA: hypothetical protein VIH27_01660 [Nitrososphaerales archaeon]
MKRSNQVQSKKPKFNVFTIETCSACNFKTKRPFQLGDYVFKEAGDCTHCNKSKTLIEMIYAEQIKK